MTQCTCSQHEIIVKKQRWRIRFFSGRPTTTRSARNQYMGCVLFVFPGGEHSSTNEYQNRVSGDHHSLFPEEKNMNSRDRNRDIFWRAIKPRGHCTPFGVSRNAFVRGRLCDATHIIVFWHTSSYEQAMLL